MYIECIIFVIATVLYACIIITFEPALYSQLSMGFILTLHVKDEGIVFSTKGGGIGPADLVAAGPKFLAKIATVIYI